MDGVQYVAGFYTTGEVQKACYWKNGQRIELPDSDEGAATSIFVHGSDIYVAGYYEVNDVRHACYWLNGSKILLEDGGASSVASGIAVRTL